MGTRDHIVHMKIGSFVHMKTSRYSVHCPHVQQHAASFEARWDDVH